MSEQNIETISDDGVSCRSSSLMIQWAVLIVGAIIFLAVARGFAAIAVGLLILVYAIQGFVSERLGVSIDASSISFPNRLLASVPLLTFGRQTLPVRSCSRIDRRTKRSLVVYSGEGRAVIRFPTSEDKNEFLNYARHRFPRIHVS